jgi:hypothetical protein
MNFNLHYVQKLPFQLNFFWFIGLEKFFLYKNISKTFTQSFHENLNSFGGILFHQKILNFSYINKVKSFPCCGPTQPTGAMLLTILL